MQSESWIRLGFSMFLECNIGKEKDLRCFQNHKIWLPCFVRNSSTVCYCQHFIEFILFRSNLVLFASTQNAAIVLFILKAHLSNVVDVSNCAYTRTGHKNECSRKNYDICKSDKRTINVGQTNYVFFWFADKKQYQNKGNNFWPSSFLF